MTVRVHFLAEDLLVEAPAGTPLRDIAEAARADLAFGCGKGSCGLCRIRVVQGFDRCSSMEPEERDFLRWIGAPDDHRLACRMRVHGDVVVDYTDLKVQP